MTEFVDFTFSTAGVPATVNSVSTARTLPARLAEVVNVKDWGATGNGVTDDFDAIQAALNWNSVELTTTATAYSGAFRVDLLTWSTAAGGTLVLTLTEAHGWAGPTALVFVELNVSSGTGQGLINGNKTATVVDPTTISFAVASDPRPFAFYGCVRPQVVSATWIANLVTVTFAEAHRLVNTATTGLNYTVAGFVDAGINGSRAITVTGATTLTFPVTGSGTISTMGTIKPAAVLTFASVPATINTVTGAYLAQFAPTCDAAWYDSQVQGTTSTTITVRAPLMADVTNGTLVRFALTARGHIFFPPGDYLISESLYFGDPNMTALLTGTPGQSTLIGNFDGYLLDRNTKSGTTGPVTIEKMKFVNTHATGGGLRVEVVGNQVRDCLVEAHFGISLCGMDYISGVSYTTVVAGNVVVRDGDLSGSIGILGADNNWSIYGNYVSGFATGIMLTSHGCTMTGNYVVDNTIGIDVGQSPDGSSRSVDNSDIRGNFCKNNGTGIRTTSAGGTIHGIYIEGGASAQYGFRNSSFLFGSTSGIDISGTFSTAAFSFANSDSNNRFNTVVSVRATASGVASWQLPTTAMAANITQCNTPVIYTLANIPGRKIASGSWVAGTMTLTTTSAHGITAGTVIEVVGLTTSGANGNGIFSAATASGTSITYALAGDPLTITASTGSVALTTAGDNSRPIKAATWLANVATIETWGPHDLNSGSSVVISQITGATTYNGALTAANITITGLSTFTFALVGDPGAPGGIAATLAATRTSLARVVGARINGMGRPNAQQSVAYGISDGAKVGGGAAAIGEYVQGLSTGHYHVIWTKNGWQRVG